LEISDQRESVAADATNSGHTPRGWRTWRYFRHARKTDQQPVRRSRRRVVRTAVSPARIGPGPSGSRTPWR
jgi:hypothetical protein